MDRDQALAEIEARLAELDPLVPDDVKRATEALIDLYREDLRELAKH